MKKKQQKYQAQMLTYAIANDGRFVNVDEVKAGQKFCYKDGRSSSQSTWPWAITDNSGNILQLLLNHSLL